MASLQDIMGVLSGGKLPVSQPDTSKPSFIGGSPVKVTPEELDSYITQASAKHGIPKSYIRAIIEKENSGHYANIKNPRSSATGMMQLIDSTARSLGVKDPTDPLQNIMGGAAYLKDMLDQFGDFDTAAAAYFQGPNAIRSKMGSGQDYGGLTDATGTTTGDYVQGVKQNLQRFQQEYGEEGYTPGPIGGKKPDIRERVGGILASGGQRTPAVKTGMSVDEITEILRGVQTGVPQPEIKGQGIGQEIPQPQIEPTGDWTQQKGTYQPKPGDIKLDFDKQPELPEVEETTKEPGLQKPIIGDFINGVKGFLRQTLINAPSVLAVMDLDQDKKELESYAKAAAEAKNDKDRKRFEKLRDRKQTQIKTALSFRELAKSAKTDSKLADKPTERLPGLGGVAQDVTVGLTQLGGQFAASAVNPAFGLYAIAAQIGGHTLETLEEYGISDKEAIPLAVLNVAIQTPLERIGMGKIAESVLKSSVPVLKKIMTGFLGEASTEAVQQLPDEFFGRVWGETKGKDIGEKLNHFASDWKQIAVDAGYAGLIGGLTGGIAAGAGHTGSKILSGPEKVSDHTPDIKEPLPEPQKLKEPDEDLQKKQQEQLERLRKEVDEEIKAKAFNEDRTEDEIRIERNNQAIDDLKKQNLVYDEQRRQYVSTEPGKVEEYWSTFGRLGRTDTPEIEGTEPSPFSISRTSPRGTPPGTPPVEEVVKETKAVAGTEQVVNYGGTEVTVDDQGRFYPADQKEITERVSKVVMDAGGKIPPKGVIYPGQTHPETGEVIEEPKLMYNLQDGSTKLLSLKASDKEIREAIETGNKPEVKKTSGKLGLHVIQYPTGKWGYVGSVPDEIGYVEGSKKEDIEKGKQFGERFGPKRISFDSMEDAIKFASSKGYDVIEKPAVKPKPQEITSEKEVKEKTETVLKPPVVKIVKKTVDKKPDEVTKIVKKSKELHDDQEFNRALLGLELLREIKGKFKLNNYDDQYQILTGKKSGKLDEDINNWLKEKADRFHTNAVVEDLYEMGLGRFDETTPVHGDDVREWISGAPKSVKEFNEFVKQRKKTIEEELEAERARDEEQHRAYIEEQRLKQVEDEGMGFQRKDDTTGDLFEGTDLAENQEARRKAMERAEVKQRQAETKGGAAELTGLPLFRNKEIAGTEQMELSFSKGHIPEVETVLPKQAYNKVLKGELQKALKLLPKGTGKKVRVTIAKNFNIGGRGYNLGGGDKAAVLFNKSAGTINVWLSPELTSAEISEAVTHELPGHYGQRVVFAANPQIHVEVRKIFDGERKAGRLQGLEKIYAKDLEGKPEASELKLFDEWVADRITDHLQKRSKDNVAVKVARQVYAYVRMALIKMGVAVKNVDDVMAAMVRNMRKAPVSEKGTKKPSYMKEAVKKTEKADTFFSPTLKAVQALKQERGTGEQMFAMITKTPGVKEAEWKWMGLDDFLKGKRLDGKTYAELQGISPDEIITIYRAVPKGEKLKDGDYITTDKEQARFYARDIVGQRKQAEEAVVVTEKVPAGDIFQKDTQRHIADEYFYIPSKKIFTKAEIEEFVRGNQVMVEEVKKGKADIIVTPLEEEPYILQVFRADDPDGNNSGMVGEILDTKNGAKFKTPEGKRFAVNVPEVKVKSFDTQREAEIYIASKTDFGTVTKYQNYQLPGGESYREVLLTIPGESSFTKYRDVLESKYRLKGRELEEKITPEEFKKLTELARTQEPVSPRYKSSHWDEPNVIAHVRLNDRYGVIKPHRARVRGDNFFSRKMDAIFPESIMQSGVVGLLDNNEVQRAVISAIPVDVVDMLKGIKLTPEDLFSQKPVDANFSSASLGDRRAILFGVSTALKNTGARIRAKIIDVLTTGGSDKLFSTLSTSDLSRAEVSRMLAFPSEIGVISKPSVPFSGTGEATKLSTMNRSGEKNSTTLHANTPDLSDATSVRAPSTTVGTDAVSDKLSSTRIAELLDRHDRNIKENTGTEQDKEKILFVEEIQSDWAREAREKGIRKEGNVKAISDGIGGYKAIDKTTGEELRNEFGMIISADTQEEAIAQVINETGVPAQPFLKNWEELTLKRVLRMAAEEGYDRVAWINGEQTAARYDLSKQIDQVQAWKKTDGKYDLRVTKGGREVYTDSGLDGKELSGIVGKDLAEKIVTEKGAVKATGYTDKANNIESIMEYRGLDLKIGGEWAVNLYDRMIPKFYEKYLKKWNTKVEAVKIGKGDLENEASLLELSDGTYAIDYNGDRIEYDTEEAAKSALKEIRSGQMVQQSIPITPEMKESVLYEGQPMFMRTDDTTPEEEAEYQEYFKKSRVSKVLSKKESKAEAAAAFEKTPPKYTESDYSAPVAPDAEAVKSVDIIKDIQGDKTLTQKLDYLGASQKTGDHISWNPKGKKNDLDFLNKAEKLYSDWKELAFPIQKVQDIAQKEDGILIEDAKNIDYAIDRKRGAPARAKQWIDDNFTPIFDAIPTKINGKKVSRGAVYAEVVKYVVAKRSKDLYEMEEKGYIDGGYDKATADKMVDFVEIGAHPWAKEVHRIAQGLWDTTQKLKQMNLEAGIFDSELFDVLTEEHYVPFDRDIDKPSKKAKIGGKDRFTATSKGIMRIKGSFKGSPIIDPVQGIKRQIYETIDRIASREVGGLLIELSKKSPAIGEMIKKVPHKWVKAGTIEHRGEIDMLLRPQMESMAHELGSKIEYTAKLAAPVGGRMAKVLGLFTEDRIKALVGATEGTVAHELGHLIHKSGKYNWLEGIVEKNQEEFNLVADSRYQGEEVPVTFVTYVRSTKEKIAEFISMYITDRVNLYEMAPNALIEFESKIKDDPILKKMIDMKPSNVQGIHSIEVANFVRDRSIPRDEDIISNLENGKIESYRVPHELAVALKDLNPETFPAIIKILAIPTKFVRAGAVGLNIDFFIPNVFKDQQDSAVNAKTIPFVDFMFGVKSFVTRDYWYRMRNLRGGGMESTEAGLRVGKLDSSRLQYGGELKQFLDPYYWKTHGIIKGITQVGWYTVKFPFDKILYNLANLSEASSRIGTFRRAVKGIPWLGVKPVSVESAAHMSRQAAGDYQRKGRHMRTANELIPFINMAFEGVDKIGRTFKDDPKRAMLKAFIYGIIPMIGFYLWNTKDEKRKLIYKSITFKDKINNHIIVHDDGTWNKIPKGWAIKWIINPIQIPYEMAAGTIYKSMPWVDFPWKNSLVKDVLMDLSPVDYNTLIPPGIKLIVEPVVNYDLYWGEKIEKPAIEAIQIPGLRWDSRTSQALKYIGKALNISPIMMQHVLTLLGAGFTKNILWASDLAIGLSTGDEDLVSKKTDITKMPVIRRFNGQLNEWNTDIDRNIREINKQLSDMNELSMGKMIRSYGHRPADVAELRKRNSEFRYKLERKRAELMKAKNEIKYLLNKEK